MISADIKSTIKQQEIKDLVMWLHLTNYYKMYFQNLKYNVQRVCIFHLILVWYAILILSVKNREGGLGGVA